MLKKNYISATTTLIGGTLGAGMFGIPYVFAQVGVLVGTIRTVIIGALLIILNLLHAEISLSLPGRPRFITLMKKLLPAKYGYIGVFTTCLQFFIALFAYVTLIGGFINTIIQPHWSLAPAISATIYSIIIGAILYSGVSGIKKYDKAIVITFILTLIVIIIYGIGFVEPSNFSFTNLTEWFLPYGVLIYALNSVPSIPIIEECLGEDRKKLPHVIIFGGILCVLIVLIWGWTVVGITGVATTQDAITGLTAHVGSWVVKLGGLVGILAIISPHLIIGEHLLDTLQDYFKTTRLNAWIITILLPLLAYLYIGGGFVNTIGFAGAVFIGIMCLFVGVMNLVLHKKHGKKETHILPCNKIWAYLIVIIFSAGILYECIKQFVL